MAAYGRHLFDVFYLYGLALSRLNTTDPSVYTDVTKLIPKLITSFDGWFCVLIRFQILLGMTGKVVINNNLSRMPFYQLYGLNPNYDQVTLLNMSFVNSTAVMGA